MVALNPMYRFFSNLSGNFTLYHLLYAQKKKELVLINISLVQITAFLNVYMKKKLSAFQHYLLHCVTRD